MGHNMFTLKTNYHRIPIRVSKQMVKLIIKTFAICWDLDDVHFNFFTLWLFILASERMIYLMAENATKVV